MKKMNYLLVSVIIIFSWFLIGCSSKKQDRIKPNFLFILVDDLGYNDLSCMGSQFYETPNVDKIASQGVIFTDGYAACAVCSPSRASLLTGKYTTQHGITDWIGAKTGTNWRKEPKRRDNFQI